MSRRRKLWWKLNKWLIYATLVIGLGALIPSNVIPGTGILAMIFPFMGIPLVLAFIYWCIRLNKRALVNAVALGIMSVPSGAWIPYAPKPNVSESAFALASFNVQAFYSDKNAAHEVSQWTKETGIDILCVQELRKRKDAPLRKQFKHAAYSTTPKGFGVAVYSNFPVVSQRGLRFTESAQKLYNNLSAQEVDLRIGQDTVRIINVHLATTGVQDGDIAFSPTEDTWYKSPLNVFKKLVSTDALRGAQGNDLIRWVKESPYPVILTGDFNTVPGGYTYIRLLGQLNDPYIDQGFGKPGTYIPLKRKGIPIKIDWTLVDPSIETLGQTTGNVIASDHSPLITYFK